ncbi:MULTISPECIES: hypothetical protein [Dermacoccus]|uniref:hypothetical protein n=1 Tax=Dermacoccus TaxID=57495 RepID=UPI000A9323F4|nr:hypothetical protein [Dermacoccus nishinomiyaensis]
MSDTSSENYTPEVDQQDGGPGAQTGGDGGENNDVASGGRSDEGSTDEGQHADAGES